MFRKFIRGSGTATVLRTLGRGIAYVVQIILARNLAPERFGVFAIGWTMLRLFAIVGHLGLDFGIIHFGSRYWKKDIIGLRSMFSLSLSGAFLSGVFFGYAFYILSPWLANSFFQKPDLEYILQGFAFAFPFVATLRVLAATSSISGNMLCGGMAEDAVQPILQITLFLATYRILPEITAALFSTVLSYALATLLGLICVGRSIPGLLTSFSYKVNDAIPLFKYSLTTIMAVAIGTFNLWGDRLIVGYYSSSADAGIYQSISLITMLTTTMLSGIKAVIAPTASKLFHDENHIQLNWLITQTNRYILYMFAPALLIVALAPGDVIEIIFGVDYKRGAQALSLLTIGQLFYLMTGVTDQFFIATGRQKKWLAISLSIFISTITLDILLIPLLGLIGAAIVSSLMMLVLNMLVSRSVKQELNFQLINRQQTKTYIALAVSGLCTFLILRYTELAQPVYHLVLAASISTILFFLIVLALGIEQNDKAYFHQLILNFRTRR